MNTYEQRVLRSLTFSDCGWFSCEDLRFDPTVNVLLAEAPNFRLEYIFATIVSVDPRDPPRWKCEPVFEQLTFDGTRPEGAPFVRPRRVVKDCWDKHYTAIETAIEQMERAPQQTIIYTHNPIAFDALTINDAEHVRKMFQIVKHPEHSDTEIVIVNPTEKSAKEFWSHYRSSELQAGEILKMLGWW